MTAAVLMHLYGLGDRTGNCWGYVQQYNKDPLRAIMKAVDEVGKVLALSARRLQPLASVDGTSTPKSPSKLRHTRRRSSAGAV